MSNQRSREAGVVMAAVLFVLVGLTIMGATAIYTASTEVEIVGNVRRAHQATVCAKTATDAAVAQLPSTSATFNVKLADNYYARTGHQATVAGASGTTAPTSISVLSGNVAAAIGESGGDRNIANHYDINEDSSSGSSTTVSLTARQPVRVVGNCGPDGATGAGVSEHEQVVMFGISQ